MPFQKVLVGSLFAIVSGVALLAQRDGVRPALVATGTITGVVVADDADHSPIRRATVTLTGPGLPSSLITTTDDEARFTFANIPSGEYRLQCSKVAFVRSYYGATRPHHGPGLPVMIADGTRATLTMVLTRGAVIAGSITNERGRPVETNVQVLEFQNVDGVRRLRNVTPPNDLTDDQGRFRVFGLPPGEYLIGAIGRAGAWSESESLSAQTRPTDGPQRRPVMYAPVYYSGAADPASATLIRVESGEERTGISFSLRPAVTSTVEGTVIDELGQPVDGAQVRALFRAEQPQEFATQILARTSMTSNGKFSLSGLPPSQYVLVAQRTSAAAPRNPSPTLWGLSTLDLVGDDVSSLQITLRPGRTVSGRIAFDGKTPPADVSAVKVGLQSAQDNFIKVIVTPTTASQDGRFTLTGVVPGRYRLQITPQTFGSSQASWTLHSALIKGRDAVDATFEVVDSVDLDEIVVRFSEQVTSLTGSVTGSEAIPAQALSVIVFSTDRAFWFSNSRRVRAIHPGANGTFATTGLPAGEYFVTAVLDFVPSELGDSAFLDVLSKSAFRFVLADGEKKSLPLVIK